MLPSLQDGCHLGFLRLGTVSRMALNVFLDVIVLLLCFDSILDWLRAWFGRVVFARARHLESNRFCFLGAAPHTMDTSRAVLVEVHLHLPGRVLLVVIPP